jgi:hypothetical protein
LQQPIIRDPTTINAVSDRSRVTATALTRAVLSVDMTGTLLTNLDGGTNNDFKVNGVSIDPESVT